jgi:small conductance mechanosensitive channel
MTSPAVVGAAVNATDLARACGPKAQQAWLCTTTYRITGSESAANVADSLAKPARILVIVLLAYLVVRILHRLIRRGIARADARARREGSVSAIDTLPVEGARRLQRLNTLASLMRSTVSVVVWTIALFTILSDLGVNLAPLLASAGIAGIALGFGAQSLVKDFLSGLFMLLEDQYGVGDVVDAGVATGTVEGVSLRTTRLRDLDGVVWHVPNGNILRIGNRSKQWARAVVDVAVAYQADVAHATQVIHSVAEAVWHDDAFAGVILDQPDVLGVESMGPGRVVIRVVARTRPQQQWRVARELRLRVKEALDAAGIAAPSA